MEATPEATRIIPIFPEMQTPLVFPCFDHLFGRGPHGHSPVLLKAADASPLGPETKTPYVLRREQHICGKRFAVCRLLRSALTSGLGLELTDPFTQQTAAHELQWD
jgi:hypothetical protein